MTYYVIHSYQHHLYWRDDCKGYTDNIYEAGAYTHEELKRANLEDTDDIIPVSEALARVPRRTGRRVLDIMLSVRSETT